MNGDHNISDVSRISGIPKDLLRMWERRYDYPAPTRDSHGNRIYSDKQLDKLVVIRQLVDQGKRPGKLVKLELPELNSMQQQPQLKIDSKLLDELLRSGDASALHDCFHQQLLAHGLRSFIHRVMAPATARVGDAWSNGELAIHEEHLYTELMKNLVRQSLAEHLYEHGKPSVMLTTVPGEQHGLGLLMIEALLRLGGAKVISFGTEMPFRDIREAASTHKVNVIALSFSASFKQDDALVMLSGLRQMIEPGIGIWAGGSAFDSRDFTIDGVSFLDGLHGLERALAEWQRSDGALQAATASPCG